MILLVCVNDFLLRSASGNGVGVEIKKAGRVALTVNSPRSASGFLQQKRACGINPACALRSLLRAVLPRLYCGRPMSPALCPWSSATDLLLSSDCFFRDPRPGKCGGSTLSGKAPEIFSCGRETRPPGTVIVPRPAPGCNTKFNYLVNFFRHTGAHFNLS